MKKKKYDELRSIIKNMINKIDKEIENKDLYNYYTEKISYLLNNFKGIKFKCYDNQIEIINRNNDSFTIKFLPNIDNFNTIITRETNWNNRYIEFKQLNFMDNIILLNESIFIKYINNDSKDISRLEKNIERKIYIGNKLTYKYIYKNELSTNENDYSKTVIEETYIKDKKAVKQLISFNNETGEYNNNYLKTNYYDAPDFNTRKNKKSLFKYAMNYCEYNDFKDIENQLKENNNIGTLKQKLLKKENI